MYRASCRKLDRQGCQIFLGTTYQIGKKYTKYPLNINIHIIYQHPPLQDPQKFTQIGIFGLKNMPSGNPVDCANQKSQRQWLSLHFPRSTGTQFPVRHMSFLVLKTLFLHETWCRSYNFRIYSYNAGVVVDKIVFEVGIIFFSIPKTCCDICSVVNHEDWPQLIFRFKVFIKQLDFWKKPGQLCIVNLGLRQPGWPNDQCVN
jgi:hypothetical protein